MKSPLGYRKVFFYGATLTFSFHAWGLDATSLRLSTENTPNTVAESHRQYCIRREAERQAQDDWDKKHPGQRKKLFDQIRQDEQAARACVRDDINRALEEDDDIAKRGTPKAIPASTPMKSDIAASATKAVPNNANKR